MINKTSYLNKDLKKTLEFINNSIQNNKLTLNNSEISNHYLNIDKIKEKYSDSILINILYKVYIDCHKKSYGSGNLLFKHLNNNLEKLNEYFSVISTEDIINSLCSSIEKEHVGFNIKTFEHFLNENVSIYSRNVKQIINYCIENCDINTIFIVRKSKNNNYKIIFESGNKINFNNCYIINKSDSIENPFIIPVDGYIESVSEINKLLESASESKDNIILFCRGAAEDVKTTISLNQKRETINLSFVSVPLDEKHVNTLKDIAIISGNDVFSTHDGKEIRNINHKTFKKINKVVIEKEDIIFLNKNKENSYSDHLSFLKEKLKENELNSNSAMAEIFKNRIQIFNSEQTIIEVPENDVSHIEINNINSVFKYLIQIIKFGACKTNYGVYPENSVDFVNASISSLKDLLNNSKYVIDNL